MKADFRTHVWDAICSRSPWRQPGQHVALMPSIEGLELEEALRRGFREQDIHIIDANPAIVATLKRRYRGVNTYGVSVHRAHRRIGEAGLRLYGASLDFCGPSTWKLARELMVCSEADCWESGARIVINVLRGREDGVTRLVSVGDSRVRRVAWFAMFLAVWNDESGILPTDRDVFRAWMLALALPRHVAVLKAARPYVSPNGQSFLSCAFTVYRASDVKNGVTQARGIGVRTASSWKQRAALALASDIAIGNALGSLVEMGVYDALGDSGAIPGWVLNAVKARQNAAHPAAGTATPDLCRMIAEIERQRGKIFNGRSGTVVE